jgi:hypothetical protein
VAVAARVVQQLTPLKRILILDWYVTEWIHEFSALTFE